MVRSLGDYAGYVKSLMPGWRQGETYDALAYAIAKVFREMTLSIESHYNETFLQTAEAERLDQYGEERGIPRLDGESDTAYRTRIVTRSVINKSAVEAAIEQAIEDVYPLETITYQLYEWYGYGPYTELGFLDIDMVNVDKGYNQFLIEITSPLPVIDRALFYSSLIDLVAEVNAFGVFFDIVYKE
jgi:hypothetical protein